MRTNSPPFKSCQNEEMTAQIADQVRFDEDPEPFVITGISGGGLFDPEAYGLKPVGFSTACWRGWHATYAVQKASLELATLGIGLSPEDGELIANGAGPRLQNVVPHKHHSRAQVSRGGRTTEEDYESPEWFFDGLSLPVRFTGGLLLGRQFIRALYVHMGFHPAWKFETVVEAIFVEGRLESSRSRSEEMAVVRQRVQSLGPGSRASKEDIAKWIEGTFSLRYPGFAE